MTPSDEDRRMEDSGPEDEALSRVYRAGAREEPPAALDRRILTAAAQEARRARRPRLRPLSSAWTLPVSLAAVIVLSVSLVLVVQPEGERARAPLLDEAPAPAGDAAPAEGEGAATREPAAGRLEQAAPKRAPAPEAEVTTPVPSRESLRRHEDTAPRSTGARQREAGPSEPSEAPASGMDIGQEPSLAEPAGAPRPPHVWLTEIEQLLAAGELDAARESLARFREHYPDYPVPASVSAGVTAPSPE